MQMATGSNSEPEEGSPSFFKVVRDPSAPHLSLPNAFVRRYMEKIPKNPILKTVAGEYSWRLKLIKMGENYCFAHGWEKLVKDVQLCIRDIVVCWLIDASTFQVIFLGANGCEKDLQFNKNNDGNVVGDGHDNGEPVGDGDVVADHQGNIVDYGDANGDGDHNGECHGDNEVAPEENLCFQKVFSWKTHRYSMTLPKKFVEDAGIEDKKSITMKDHEGKEWIMKIQVDRSQCAKYHLSVGWLIFREYHKISDGDVCIFTFNKKEGVLNLAQLHRSKTPTIQETTSTEAMNRKSRRPPLHGGRDVKIEDMWSPTENPGGGSGGGGGGGGEVKIEYESGPEMELEMRKRGRPPYKNPGGGYGSGVRVKIEDESLPQPQMVERKRKRGRPPLGGGVVLSTEPETERLISRSKHVIYF